jgi:hypothetical protein
MFGKKQLRSLSHGHRHVLLFNPSSTKCQNLLPLVGISLLTQAHSTHHTTILVPDCFTPTPALMLKLFVTPAVVQMHLRSPSSQIPAPYPPLLLLLRSMQLLMLAVERSLINHLSRNHFKLPAKMCRSPVCGRSLAG